MPRSEEQRLRHFVDVVDRCLNSAAVRQGTLKSTLRLDLSGGIEEVVDADFGDAQHVRSLLIDFRKFALLNDDDAYFNKIHNVAYQRATDEETRSKLRRIRELWKDALTPQIELQFAEVSFTGTQALEAWLYGEVFHDHPDQIERLAALTTDATRALFRFVCQTMIEAALVVARLQRDVIARMLGEEPFRPTTP